MSLVVADDVVTIFVIFVKLLICRLRGTLLILLDYIIWIKHRLVLAFCVQTELFPAVVVCDRG